MNRVTLAIALLLGCCGVDTWLRLSFSLSVYEKRGRGDPVSRAAARFDAMRHELPAHGAVGYVFVGENKSSVVPELMVAKYHLAPLIVEDAEEQEIILEDD